ncbi:MAG TPA: MFS transporter [Chitinophagaceae bacterium]|jgi:putative MFS transporter|nr:MFS transporter [Chitinophagaceae bacterium]HNA92998.1 MFS transporter [Chitinophagaceae bacterium]HNA96930.1 MFS transporter [Chitinophagaceae bacterium]HND95619.1 MFS transporter [Chitinophagaceae bacterium]HNF45612.1 MFS transporter [Chitinophagaceae bacterium]
MKKQYGIFSIPVIVAALGYFVDIYDLLLFSITRIESLRSFGLSPEQITIEGESILIWQMAGLMIGGIVWGMMGDKKGRLSVLFGSIILYSLANIANGFVQNTEQIRLIRFIAGLGLAGELGAGITLVSELVVKEKRGIATSLVAGLGLTGAVAAFIIKENFEWRTCYFIGGGMGLLLLALRLSVFESGMFHEVRQMDVKRGNIWMLFNNRDRLKRYVLSILIGLPTWFVIGVLVSFSSEFGKWMNIKEKIDPGRAIMYAYSAIAIGDIFIGFVSQWLRSRKKALYLFYVITGIFILLFFTILWNGTAERMYWICAGLGFGTGFWAIFITMGAEQFGTNLRATAATTIPNMVRGMLAVFILPLFQMLRSVTDYYTGGWLAAVIIMLITVVSALFLEETFNKDLNFVER